MKQTVNIAIFASGSGTNAENIIKYFINNPTINIKRVFSNNINAGVLTKAQVLNVPVKTFSRDEFMSGEVVSLLKEENISYIVLAGFLWLVPKNFISSYPNRIINIHPALLPQYGGKGMYGMNVHAAVISNKEKESGITIHFVNEEYDKGDIIFQAKCIVEDTDTPESLAQKIHELEYEFFPKIVEQIALG